MQRNENSLNNLKDFFAFFQEIIRITRKYFSLTALFIVFLFIVKFLSDYDCNQDIKIENRYRYVLYIVVEGVYLVE